MKHYLLAAATALLFTGFAANAQDVKEEKNVIREERKNKTSRDNKIDEYEEIIIKRKNDEKDAKVTIEIREDQVFVDGKPIDEYVNDEVSIKLRDVNRFKMAPGASTFRLDRNDWEMDNDELTGKEKAFLGVMTSGSSQGARVEKVTENSAAAKAGLKEGDVITKVNDKGVFDHEQLSEAISGMKPDEKVTITYKRDGRENKTTATLGKRKSFDTRSFRYHPGDFGPIPPMAFDFDRGDFGDVFTLHGKPRLGIKAQDTEEGNGVKVLDVDEGSAAEKAGVKQNDVITAFDGKKVNTADELAKASREAKDKTSVKIDVNRNGKSQTLEVKVPKKLKTANL